MSGANSGDGEFKFGQFRLSGQRKESGKRDGVGRGKIREGGMAGIQALLKKPSLMREKEWLF